MGWTMPDAKIVRENLRRISDLNGDLPEHVCDFADFFADHLRDNSRLTPKIWVMAYRRAHLLWLLGGHTKVGGYFNKVTEAVHDAGFAEEAIREFEAD